MKYSVQWKNPPVCSQCNTSHDLPELWCKKCKGINKIQAIQGRKHSEMHPSTLWDFSDLFPSFSHHISLQEGLTPVVSIKNIENLLGLKMKLEFRNPTGSFRDSMGVPFGCGWRPRRGIEPCQPMSRQRIKRAISETRSERSHATSLHTVPLDSSASHDSSHFNLATRWCVKASD